PVLIVKSKSRSVAVNWMPVFARLADENFRVECHWTIFCSKLERCSWFDEHPARAQDESIFCCVPLEVAFYIESSNSH
ncbi:unnamed protein product, partial [Oikopleura dioica]